MDTTRRYLHSSLRIAHQSLLRNQQCAERWQLFLAWSWLFYSRQASLWQFHGSACCQLQKWSGWQVKSWGLKWKLLHNNVMWKTHFGVLTVVKRNFRSSTKHIIDVHPWSAYNLDAFFGNTACCLERNRETWSIGWLHHCSSLNILCSLFLFWVSPSAFRAWHAGT